MMFLLGVLLIALAVLFALTLMALSASDAVRHPARLLSAMGAVLVLGLALLLD